MAVPYFSFRRPRAELEGYGLSEEILSYKRRWFVVRADAAPVVSDLLAQRRPIRDRTANRESSQRGKHTVSFSPPRRRGVCAANR